MQIWTEEIKPSLFVDNVVVYIEQPEEMFLEHKCVWQGYKIQGQYLKISCMHNAHLIAPYRVDAN